MSEGEEGAVAAEAIPEVEAATDAGFSGPGEICVSGEDVLDAEGAEGKRGCQTCLRFDDIKLAQGYNVLGFGRGSLLIANIFLITAVTFLANEHVGCVEENEDGIKVVIEDCDGRVYGVFRPTTMITNVVFAAGLLSAFLMPLMGAIVDYTPYRWEVGVISAILITVIQAAQIGLTVNTWFWMALLQAFALFFYEVQITSCYAYLPALAELVPEETMSKYTSVFFSCVFSSQVAFLVLIIVIAASVGLTDVQTAMTSQALNTVILIPTFYIGWKLLPKVSTHHKLPVNPRTGKQRSLFTQGFVELWNTTKRINKDYKKGLRWFLLSTIFAEAAADAFTIVSVVILDEQMGLSAIEVGVFFMVGMIFMPPGTILSKLASSRTNPKVSYMLSMVFSQLTCIVGSLALHKDNIIPGGYIWAVFVGLNMGWYYPAQSLFFGRCTPCDGHETELAGLFSYCLIILSWLPNLIFTALVEAGVEMQYGLIVISCFFTVGFVLLLFASSWEEILEECTAVTRMAVAAAGDNEGMKKESSSEDEVGRTDHSSSILQPNGEDTGDASGSEDADESPIQNKC